MLNSNQVYTLDIIYTKIDWFEVSLSRPLTKFLRLRKRLLQQSYFLLSSFVKWSATLFRLQFNLFTWLSFYHSAHLQVYPDGVGAAGPLRPGRGPGGD